MDADGEAGAERQAPFIPSGGGNGRRFRRDLRGAVGARGAAGRRSSRSPRRPGSVAERHDIAQRHPPFSDIEGIAEPRIVRRAAAEPEGDVVGRVAQPQVEAACGAPELHADPGQPRVQGALRASRPGDIEGPVDMPRLDLRVHPARAGDQVERPTRPQELQPMRHVTQPQVQTDGAARFETPRSGPYIRAALAGALQKSRDFSVDGERGRDLAGEVQPVRQRPAIPQGRADPVDRVPRAVAGGHRGERRRELDRLLVVHDGHAPFERDTTVEPVPGVRRRAPHTACQQQAGGKPEADTCRSRGHRTSSVLVRRTRPSPRGEWPGERIVPGCRTPVKRGIGLLGRLTPAGPRRDSSPGSAPWPAIRRRHARRPPSARRQIRPCLDRPFEKRVSWSAGFGQFAAGRVLPHRDAPHGGPDIVSARRNGLSVPCAARRRPGIEKFRLRFDDPVRAHRSDSRGTGRTLNPSKRPQDWRNPSGRRDPA